MHSEVFYVDCETPLTPSPPNKAVTCTLAFFYFPFVMLCLFMILEQILKHTNTGSDIQKKSCRYLTAYEKYINR